MFNSLDNLPAVWNVSGSLERWGQENWLEVMSKLISADSYICFNPISKERVTKTVADLLDSERTGNIDLAQLKNALSLDSLFLESELKTTKEILTRSRMCAVDQCIN